MFSNQISYITGQGLPGYVPTGGLFKNPVTFPLYFSVHPSLNSIKALEWLDLILLE